MQAPASGTPERKALNSSIEGVLYFVVHASRLGWASSVAEIMPSALRLMLAVQEDSDKDLAQVPLFACVRCSGLEEGGGGAPGMFLNRTSTRSTGPLVSLV
jgi:hypothetical protein